MRPIDLFALGQALKGKADEAGPGLAALARHLGLAAREQGGQRGAALQRKGHGLVLGERAFRQGVGT